MAGAEENFPTSRKSFPALKTALALARPARASNRPAAAAHDLLSALATLHSLRGSHMIWTRSRIESLLMRIQSAFLENPMLSLTLPAAQRRFGADEVACAGVLGALMDAQVLTKHEGAYRRNFPRPAGTDGRLNQSARRGIVRVGSRDVRILE